MKKTDDQSSQNLKAQRKAIMKGIEAGERNIKEGRIFTHEQAKEKLKKWLRP